MKSIKDKIDSVVSEFSALENDDGGTTAWEKKYEKIIELGKAWPGLSDEFKIDDLKLKGCQSQVWLRARLGENGVIIYEGDSDAILVKGLVALMLSIYSHETPDTVLITEPTFLRSIGLDKGLSPSRTNGLNSMLKQIKYYATAFKILSQK